MPPVLPPTFVPPTFAHSEQAPSRTGLDVLALPLFDHDGDLELGPGASCLEDDLGVDLLSLLEPVCAGARPGDLTSLSLPGFLVHVVGVGDGSPTALRRAGAALARATRGRDAVASSVHAVGDGDGLTAFVAGAVLGSFRYSLRTGEKDPAVGRVLLAAAPVDPAVLARAEAIARASWEARRLATVPSNIKSPAWLADEVVRMGEAKGLKTRVWEVDQLEKEGFGGIVAVGRASATPPRLVQLEYTPAHARRAPHVVLVGKGITFDTGGLSIKPGESMVNMKRDMTGAGVVAATMSALGEVGSPVRVTGLLAIAENAIGGAALRPGDVIRHWGGRTTEVTNTDAEGRLVMADALQYAATKLRPDLLVDVATLTGAMKVALGLSTGGYFATDDAIARLIDRAAVASGERMWRMPLAEEYESLLESKIADADNAPRQAQAITAALFLQHFTGGLPWAHLDIASVGDSLRDSFEWTKGPTGFGARLLLHWLGSDQPLEGVRA
ncbi:MAG TPA: leucyl aminopeptidase family protein [Marmoricola sp.]|nr:leucyl aminopeptidase family protein [Marmoricola sp.]